MRGKLLIATLGGLLVAREAAAQSPPGTVRLLSGNGSLVDLASGDAWVELTDAQPGKFLVYGPGKLQAEIRVNLPADKTQGPDAFVDIFAAGKPLKRYRLSPRASGTDGWKGRSDVRPSGRIGFFLELDPGPHAYELRVTGAPQGAGLLLVSADKARQPLAANAPVVPAKPPPPVAPAATPTPGSVVVTGTPIPRPTPPRSVDQIAATGRSFEAPLDRYPGGVALKGGIAFPIGGNASGVFPAAGVTAVEARWALGAARTLAVGLEVSTVGFGAVAPVDPSRAIAPMAVNLQITPAILHLAWLPPGHGRLRPYLAGGPGLVYATSSAQTQATTRNESNLAPAASALAGVQLDLAPEDFREGSRKVFLEGEASWWGLDFAAHPYGSWTAGAVLAGLELKF